MRILILEYITGGGMSSTSLCPALVREATLMLQALAKDLGELSGIRLSTMRDARLGTPDFEAKVYTVRNSDEFKQIFSLLLERVDAVWPIAPETQGVLEDISRRVLDAGKILLNSSPAAVRMAASKRRTLRRLEDCGLPVVPSYDSWQDLPEHAGEWVLKPDDGVGCEGLRLCRDIEALEGNEADRLFVIQPLISGLPVSMSMLCEQGRAWLLSCNLQRIIRRNDGFCLQGCVVNGFEDKQGVYRRLAEDIAAFLPHLWGYVGVDLIVTEQGPRVLEVNPRLTTSYAGLHAAMAENPALMVLGLLEGQDPVAGRSLQRDRIEVALEGACEG